MGSVASLSRLQSAATSAVAADAVRHDDARLSDARTPVAHTHAPTIVSAGSLANGATWTPDASAGTLFRASAAGAGLTIAGPTVGQVDGVQINIEVLASVATSLTIDGGIVLTTGITSPVAVPSGKRWFGGLRYITGVGWVLLASTQLS